MIDLKYSKILNLDFTLIQPYKLRVKNVNPFFSISASWSVGFEVGYFAWIFMNHVHMLSPHQDMHILHQ